MQAMGPLRAVCQTLFVWHTAARPSACNLGIGTIRFYSFASRRSLSRSGIGTGSIILPPPDFAHASIRTLYVSCSELRDILGSVKIGAAISKSVSGFPAGATVAVTR